MNDKDNIESQIQTQCIDDTIISGPALHFLVSMARAASNRSLTEFQRKELILDTYYIYYLKYPLYFNQANGSELSFLKLSYIQARHEYYKKLNATNAVFREPDENENVEIPVYDKYNNSDIIPYICLLIVQHYNKCDAKKLHKKTEEIALAKLVKNIDINKLKSKYKVSAQRINGIAHGTALMLRTKINRDGTPK